MPIGFVLLSFSRRKRRRTSKKTSRTKTATALATGSTSQLHPEANLHPTWEDQVSRDRCSLSELNKANFRKEDILLFAVWFGTIQREPKEQPDGGFPGSPSGGAIQLVTRSVAPMGRRAQWRESLSAEFDLRGIFPISNGTEPRPRGTNRNLHSSKGVLRTPLRTSLIASISLISQRSGFRTQPIKSGG